MVRAGQFSKEEAERHPSKNALTRALGVDFNVSADAPMAAVSTGDTLLLCSDGLSNMVPEEEMTEILKTGKDLQAKADALVERAKKNGGLDNITVIVIDV
jgi:protein phosphatase